MKTKIGLLFAVSLLVGVIHVFPYILFPRELGSDYRGIVLLGQPDAENYLTELREAYRGNMNLGNGVLYEHKTASGTWLNYVPENLVGFIGGKLQIKMLDMVLAMNFFLPVFIFILLFYLTWLLARNFMAGILGGLLAVFTPHIFWGYSEVLKSYLHLTLPFYAAFLPFNRPFNPQLVIIPFLLFLVAFVRFLQQPTIKRALVAGILLGLDFYFYFFWSYLYPLLGFVFLLALPTRSKALLRGILIIGAVSLVTALPVAARTFSFLFGSKRILESAYVATPTHKPIVGTVEHWVIGVILLLCFLYWRKKISRVSFLFLSSLMFSSLLVMNQQIVTGVIVQPHHYTLYLNPMMVAVALAVSAFAAGQWFYQLIIKRFIPVPSKVLGSLVVLLLILFCIAEGYSFQSMSYNWMKGSYANMQNQAGVMEWLNQHSSDGSVVLGYINNWSFDQLPIYTHNNLYVSLHGRHYELPSQDEFRDRLQNYALVLGMDEPTFAYMISDAGQFHYLFWGFRYFNPQPAGNYFTYDEAPLLPKSLGEEWVAKYREKLKRDILQEVKTYRLDYILYGPKSNPFFTIDPIFMKHLTPVFEDASFILYKVK